MKGRPNQEERSSLAQLRSGYSGLMLSYKSIIKKDASLIVCADCGLVPYGIKYLFVCQAHPTAILSLSGISRGETQIEMNMDWKANNNMPICLLFGKYS